MSKHDCKLMLALDLPDRESALDMLTKLRGNLEWVKIGLQMYLAYGSDFVREVADMGFKIFLDLKLYDIQFHLNSMTQIGCRNFPAQKEIPGAVKL